MNMLDEETLAGGQGSVLPAHKQTGILSYSSFACTISTHGGLSTRVHKQYMRMFALSLSFISQTCCCISLYLYSTFLPSSSLYIHHSRLTSRIIAELCISSSPSASHLSDMQQHSPLPEGNWCSGAPCQHRVQMLAPQLLCKVTLCLQSNKTVFQL